jgi:hypothetical protein
MGLNRLIKKKILFSGCSFTAECGFVNENRLKYHWPQLIIKKYNSDIKNIAVGGMSNEEIFLRTSEELINQKYDLVIVMWSGIEREWEYFAEKNIDDFTIINRGEPDGFNSSDPNIKLYARLHYTYFNNLYVKLKKWLILTIALEKLLKASDQPFIFIKGFENLLEDFKSVSCKENLGFVKITQKLKEILDFDNRLDDYINQKISVIKKLILVTDKDFWLNFNTNSFRDSTVDISDDGSHPGIVTNQNLVDDLIKYIDKRMLI